MSMHLINSSIKQRRKPRKKEESREKRARMLESGRTEFRCFLA